MNSSLFLYVVLNNLVSGYIVSLSLEMRSPFLKYFLKCKILPPSCLVILHFGNWDKYIFTQFVSLQQRIIFNTQVGFTTELLNCKLPHSYREKATEGRED